MPSRNDKRRTCPFCILPADLRTGGTETHHGFRMHTRCVTAAKRTEKKYRCRVRRHGDDGPHDTPLATKKNAMFAALRGAEDGAFVEVDEFLLMITTPVGDAPVYQARWMFNQPGFRCFWNVRTHRYEARRRPGTTTKGPTDEQGR